MSSQDCMVNEGALSIASSINLLSTHVLVCTRKSIRLFFRSCITGEKFDAADAFTNDALLLWSHEFWWKHRTFLIMNSSCQNFFVSECEEKSGRSISYSDSPFWKYEMLSAQVLSCVLSHSSLREVNSFFSSPKDIIGIQWRMTESYSIFWAECALPKSKGKSSASYHSF